MQNQKEEQFNSINNFTRQFLSLSSIRFINLYLLNPITIVQKHWFLSLKHRPLTANKYTTREVSFFSLTRLEHQINHTRDTLNPITIVQRYSFHSLFIPQHHRSTVNKSCTTNVNRLLFLYSTYQINYYNATRLIPSLAQQQHSFPSHRGIISSRNGASGSR